MPDREKVIRGLECCIGYGIEDTPGCEDCPYNDMGDTCERIRPLYEDALALLKAEEAVTGETSDGYHTFNELYHHRAVLFSVIVANYSDRAWKAKKHHDGTMYDGMFIVGIDTPDGQATYHYDIDPYWDMFECRVLDNAPEWDGHTPAQAIERIGKLKAQEPRVMTQEEIEALPDGDDDNAPVCVEQRYPLDRWDGGAHAKWVGARFVHEEYLSDNRYYNRETYGTTWRCWTGWPILAQREGTPWN